MARAKNLTSLEPAMKPGNRRTWSDAIYMTPSDEKVAKLYESHGFAAICERWSWIDPRTLSEMSRRGR